MPSFPSDILKDIATAVDPNKCVALMPFHQDFAPVKQAIKDACVECGLAFSRADEITHNHAIIQDIVTLIHGSRFIVADLTGLNANVLYEVGLAHALKETVILITQDAKELPFDLQQLRAIPYENSEAGLAVLRGQLVDLLKAMQATTPTRPYYRPISIEEGLGPCLRRIADEFEDSMTRHGEQVAMVRCMPAEITTAMIAGRGGGLRAQLERYQSFIRDIVVEGEDDDNWDYSIYGTTSDPAINRETAAFVQGLYFGESLPGTSMVGFDPTLFDIGFIVLGSSTGNIEAFKAETAILLFHEGSTARYGDCIVVKDATFGKQVLNSWYKPLSLKAQIENRYGVVTQDSKLALQQAAEQFIVHGGAPAADPAPEAPPEAKKKGWLGKLF